ncbi:hypothetical protein ColTof4_13582 [Colletotrichum tofieldiae]|nr:hypothetical protein ColTof3_14531 [Colletotrichum tofieldiae]GKT81159.1 hypothetical protein ColTof4_13582 [Colletotrichum tofieldiae]
MPKSTLILDGIAHAREEVAEVVCVLQTGSWQDAGSREFEDRSIPASYAGFAAPDRGSTQTRPPPRPCHDTTKCFVRH